MSNIKLHPYSKVIGSLYVCMYVCVCLNKSKMAQPIELKFCDMLPIVPGQVLSKKNLDLGSSLCKKP